MCEKLGKINFPKIFSLGIQPILTLALYTINCSESFQKIQLNDGGHWYPINYPISIDSKGLTKDQDSQICGSVERFSLPLPSDISHVFTPNSLTLFNCSLSVDFTSPRNCTQIGYWGYNIYYPLLNDIHSMYKHHIFHQNVQLSIFRQDDCINCFYVNGGQCKTDDRNHFFCFIVPIHENVEIKKEPIVTITSN